MIDPPSATIVWPVMKSLSAAYKNTSAANKSSAISSRLMLRLSDTMCRDCPARNEQKIAGSCGFEMWSDQKVHRAVEHVIHLIAIDMNMRAGPCALWQKLLKDAVADQITVRRRSGRLRKYSCNVEHVHIGNHCHIGGGDRVSSSLSAN